MLFSYDVCWLVGWLVYLFICLLNDWMPFFELLLLLSFSGIIKLQSARVKYINQSDGISSIHVVLCVCVGPKRVETHQKHHHHKEKRAMSFFNFISFFIT